MQASSRWIAIALTTWLGACFSEGSAGSADTGTASTGGEVCPEGSVTCACYGNGTCDAGLTCQPDLQACIPEDCTPGALNCGCDGGSCQDAGTQCIDGLCQVPPSASGTGTSNGTSGSATDASADATAGDTTSSVDSTGAEDCVTDECTRFVFVLEPGIWAPSEGLDAAAVACTTRASMAGLPGGYLPYLATTTATAMDNAQIAASDGFTYVRPPFASPVIVAVDGGGFVPKTGGLVEPINAYADGSVVGTDCGTAAVATGVGVNGEVGQNCGDWMDMRGKSLDAGGAFSTDETFQWGCGGLGCADDVRIYCVQAPSP